jgi:hypothetical protein
MTWLWRTLALLALFGGAAYAIRRAGDRLRTELGGAGGTKGSGLTPEEIDAILASGLATPATLFAMSPAEQKLLAAAARAGKGPATT